MNSLQLWEDCFSWFLPLSLPLLTQQLSQLCSCLHSFERLVSGFKVTLLFFHIFIKFTAAALAIPPV